MVAAGPDKDEVVWLVKSGDRILGPFTRDEIKQRLYAKELVVIDEVITPMRRWRYIRDEPAFAVVVEDIRKANLGSREDTELGTLANTQTATTPTDLTEDIDVRKETITGLIDKTDPGIQDAEIVEEKKSTVTRVQSPQPVKQYGSAQDQRVQQNLNRSSRMIWALTLVVLVGAGFAFWRVQSLKTTLPQGPDISKMITEADQLSDFGHWKQAAAIYRKVHGTGFDDPSFLIRYATAALRSGTETAPVRFIESIRLNNMSVSDPRLRARQETVQGLAWLMESGGVSGKQLSRARDLFASAASSDPDLIAARFNRAMVDYLELNLMSNLEQAQEKAKVDPIVDEFSRAENLARSSHDPHDRGSAIAAQLMIVRTRLKSKAPFYAERMREYLSIFTPNIIQFWQEAMLLKSYASAISGKPDILATLPSELKSMLGADPFLTDEHYTDPLLHLRPLSWNSLQPICMETVQVAKTVLGPTKQPSPYALAAAEFCNFKKGDKPEAARKGLESIVYRNQNDVLLRSLLAYFKLSLDEASAKSELNSIGVLADDMLGVALLGRLCPKTDFACIASHFNNSFLATPDPAYLLIGAAQNDFKSNDARSAQVKLDRVRQKSPHYLPLMELDQEREGSAQ